MILTKLVTDFEREGMEALAVLAAQQEQENEMADDGAQGE